ncbi:hypothetical protein BDV11DRAFT_188076 [Aspergillus similis]
MLIPAIPLQLLLVVGVAKVWVVAVMRLRSFPGRDRAVAGVAEAHLLCLGSILQIDRFDYVW